MTRGGADIGAEAYKVIKEEKEFTAALDAAIKAKDKTKEDEFSERLAKFKKMVDELKKDYTINLVFLFAGIQSKFNYYLMNVVDAEEGGRRRKTRKSRKTLKKRKTRKH